MKRWYALVFSLLVCASYLCGYASPQDRQYVDYFLHLQAADLFRSRAFLLNWSCAYINVNSLQGVDFSFSCYRTLSINEARALLISVAEELVNKINKDPSIKERCLLSEPFTLKQLCLKIETENVFSAQVDPETIRVMYLDRGTITYESYRASTLFYGRTVTSRETLEMALMLLGKNPSFDDGSTPAAAAQKPVSRPLPDAAVKPRVEVAEPESALKDSQPVRYIKEISPPSDFPQAGPEVPLSESSSVFWEDAVPPEPEWIQQIRATGGLTSFTGAAVPPPSPVEEVCGPSGTARWGEREGLSAPAKPIEASLEEKAVPQPPLPRPEPVQPLPSEQKSQEAATAPSGIGETVRTVLPRFHDLWRQVFPQPVETAQKPVADKPQKPLPRRYGLWKDAFPTPPESPVEEPSSAPQEPIVQEPIVQEPTVQEPTVQEPAPSDEEPPISVEVMRTVQVVFIQEQLFPLPIWNGLQLETFAEPKMSAIAEATQTGASTDDLSKITAHPPHKVLVPAPIESSEPDSWSIDRWFEEMGLIPKEEPSPAVEEEVPPPLEEQPMPDAPEDETIVLIEEPLPVVDEPQESVEEPLPAPVEPETIPQPEPKVEEPSSSGGWFSWLTSTSSPAPDVVPIPATPAEPEPKVEEPVSSGGWFSWQASVSTPSPVPDVVPVPAEPELKVEEPLPAEEDHSTLAEPESVLPEPLTEAIVQPQPEPELPETPPQDLVEPQPILTEPEVEESSVGEWFAWLAPSSVSDAQEEAGPTAAGGQPSLGEDSGATESDEEILAWVERFGSWAREKVPDEPVSPQLKIPEPQSEEASPAVVNQLDELARSEEKLLGADSSAPIAERLGEVTRPDEVWKDLDQDDYCPDDDNGAEQPVQTPQEPIAERLGDVVRPDEVWKDLDQDDHCPRDIDDLDEEVSYFNRTSRV